MYNSTQRWCYVAKLGDKSELFNWAYMEHGEACMREMPIVLIMHAVFSFVSFGPNSMHNKTQCIAVCPRGVASKTCSTRRDICIPKHPSCPLESTSNHGPYLLTRRQLNPSLPKDMLEKMRSNIGISFGKPSEFRKWTITATLWSLLTPQPRCVSLDQSTRGFRGKRMPQPELGAPHFVMAAQLPRTIFSLPGELSDTSNGNDDECAAATVPATELQKVGLGAAQN